MTDQEEPEFTLDDFTYLTSSLAYALYEGLTLEDIYATVHESESAEEFDAGVCAAIRLKEIVSGSEPF